MNLSISPKSFLFVCLSFAVVISAGSESFAQDRERVVRQSPQAAANEDNNQAVRPTTGLTRSRETRSPGLTNQIVIVTNRAEREPLVRKTSSSRAINEAATTSAFSYAATTRSMMTQSIRAKMGIPYRYSTEGPNTYDCSGFVWKVFEESGIPIMRTSAREFWNTFEPVFGDDRFQFGTLVFFNRLGHVGIVADKNGFYHASSSKGVTYSTFKGYWSKRIVGYRRVPFYQDRSED